MSKEPANVKRGDDNRSTFTIHGLEKLKREATVFGSRKSRFNSKENMEEDPMSNPR